MTTAGHPVLLYRTPHPAVANKHAGPGWALFRRPQAASKIICSGAVPNIPYDASLISGAEHVKTSNLCNAAPAASLQPTTLKLDADATITQVVCSAPSTITAHNNITLPPTPTPSPHSHKTATSPVRTSQQSCAQRSPCGSPKCRGCQVRRCTCT